MQENNKKYKESNGAFSIENFRVFDEKFEFDFKPITFLIGPNSSGKSSLMKLLSAISASVKGSMNNTFVPKSLGSSIDNNNALFVDFGKSLIQKDEPLLFIYKSNNEHLSKLNVEYSLSYKNLSSFGSLRFDKFSLLVDNEKIFIIEEFERDYQVSLNPKAFLGFAKKYLNLTKKSKKPFKHLFNNYDKILPGKIFCASTDFTNEVNDIEQRIFERNKNFEFRTDSFTEMFITRYFGGDDFGDNGLSGFFQFIFLGVIRQGIINELKNKGIDCELELSDFGKFLIEGFPGDLQKDYTNFLSNGLDYVHTPVYKKARDRVFYLNENKTTSFDILMKAYIQSNLYFFKEGVLRSDSVIDKWLQKFDLGKTWIVRRVEPSEQYFIVEIVKENGELINIADLGYGAGQVLGFILLPFYLNLPTYNTISTYNFTDKDVPKIIENQGSEGIRKVTYNDIFDASGNRTSFNVYLEEPETNLHPNWQSTLAELIVYQISIGIHFVIETHSEYLIRKIQNLVAQEKCEKNDVVIYYFNSEKEKAKAEIPAVKEIRIKTNGTLSESFGTGFFDEAGRLSLELLSLNSLSKN